MIVSQHGADGHVWDPLAHLSLTTTAMGEAARLVDRLAHRYAGGRWLATGGGGYAIYRVVPRAWALTWLAGAHREAPRLLPEEWRARWAGEAARWGDGPLPLGFEDEPGVPSERSVSPAAASAAVRTVGLVRMLTVPAMLRVAEERGWWSAEGSGASSGAPSARAAAAGAAEGMPALVAPLTPEMLDRLRLAPRVDLARRPERWTVAAACGARRRGRGRGRRRRGVAGRRRAGGARPAGRRGTAAGPGRGAGVAPAGRGRLAAAGAGGAAGPPRPGARRAAHGRRARSIRSASPGGASFRGGPPLPRRRLSTTARAVRAGCCGSVQRPARPCPAGRRVRAPRRRSSAGRLPAEATLARAGVAPAARRPERR